MSHPSDGFTGIVHPEVRDYMGTLAREDDPIVARMEAYAAERGFPLIGREAGQWLAQLTVMIGGRRVFELGSGWGFSAYFFARAVGPEGEVIGSEKDAWELDAHRRLFSDHPYASRIDIRQGGAFEVLAGTQGDFDVVFCDIDKQGYPRALDEGVARLRPGGLFLADNVLWGGKTARPAAPDDPSTQALRAFNETFFAHPGLDALILPVGDGLAVGRKR